MNNLQDRLMDFSKEIITLCKSLPKDTVSAPLVNQLVRSATSIGANYSEAQNSSSRKDFRNKVYICKKEAEETKYWLKLLAHNFPQKEADLKIISSESQEILKILQSIATKVSATT